MAQNILQTLEALPLGVKRVYYDAFKLAHRELKINVVDASVLLLAIMKLGNTNASAKWLHGIGLTDALVSRSITREFSVSAQSPVVIPVNQSINSTISYLCVMRQDSHSADALYIGHVLEAIVYSESPTVHTIFASVKLSMVEVRKRLGSPSVQDVARS